MKNGIKYWCGQIGITVSEKRERMTKLCGFVTPEIKVLLGDKKQVHVFAGIKLIEEEEDKTKDLNSFSSSKVETPSVDPLHSAFNRAVCD
jgi:hypothetical protein